jgi:hypothetical protein
MILIKVRKQNISKICKYFCIIQGYKWSMSRLRQFLMAKHGYEIV